MVCRWSVDRGGPGPLTTGSMLGRGISRGVWPPNVVTLPKLKVKWTHFERPPYNRANHIWIQRMGSFLALYINTYLKMWYWSEGSVKECGISPQPIKEENKGYWVPQWLIIRPTFRCLSFEEGGKSQKSPLKSSFVIAFDECTISFKKTVTTKSLLVIWGWVDGMSSCVLTQ